MNSTHVYKLYRFSLPEFCAGKLYNLPIKRNLKFKSDLFILNFFFFKFFFFNYYLLDFKTFSFYFWWNQQGYFLSEACNLNFFFWSCSSFLKTYYYLSIGRLLLYKKSFFLSGRVNRVVVLRRRILVLKLGLSSDIILHALMGCYFKTFKLKHSFRIFSTNLNAISNFTFLIRHIRYRGTYTGRGVRIYKEKFVLKKRPDFGKFGVKMSFY